MVVLYKLKKKTVTYTISHSFLLHVQIKLRKERNDPKTEKGNKEKTERFPQEQQIYYHDIRNGSFK